MKTLADYRAEAEARPTEYVRITGADFLAIMANAAQLRAALRTIGQSNGRLVTSPRTGRRYEVVDFAALAARVEPALAPSPAIAKEASVTAPCAA